MQRYWLNYGRIDTGAGGVSFKDIHVARYGHHCQHVGVVV